MHMILIAIIFVFNFSNAQLLKLDTIAPSYNDWLSLRQKDTSIAELFLNTHIAAQFDNMQLIKDRMNHNNSLTNQNSNNNNGQHKINGYFSIAFVNGLFSFTPDMPSIKKLYFCPNKFKSDK